MANVKLKSKGFKKILRSEALRSILEAEAEAIAARADAATGPGSHFVDSDVGKNRARAAVVTGSNAAKRAEATSGNLSKQVL